MATQPNPADTGFGKGSVPQQTAVKGANTGPDWNTQWNNYWNQAWNAGYNNGGMPSADSSFNSALQQGYAAGQQAYRSKQTGGSAGTGGTPPTPTPTPVQGPSQDEINNQINDAYNSSYDYLGQVESTLRNQLPGVLQQATDNYNLDQKTLDQSNQSNSATLNFQQDQANQKKESQQAQIRRLYSDLNRGYQQKFGGATSAGQAASEIANVEQQRQTGSLFQNYNDTVKQIQMKQLDIDQQYQLASQKLKQQKDQSIAQAQQDFTNKLLDIASKRAELDTNKAQARLSALLDLRNKVYAINMQNTQFEQTLQAQKQAAQLQLQNYQALAGSGVSAATNAYNQYANGLTTPTSGLTVNGLANAFGNGALTLTGQINPKKDEPLTGAITNNSSLDYLKALGLNFGN